jgi:hypothetical protein
MKFTVSTKPLKNVTSLGIIKANISKFFYRSNIVQITATRDTLKLNIEASGIKTRMTLKGSGDSDTPASIMVDCAKFKSLIDSIETEVVSIEFIEGGMYIHAGTSKFAVPQMIDVNDVQLNEPIDQYTAASTLTIKPADWQFIKDHQMYAISNSENHPVYKNVWISKDTDVIVGDYDIGMFTYSKRGDFGSTCLLPPSLINLLTSIPEGSTISKVNKEYVLNITTDSYSMITEFTPKYEDDESVGSYNAEIILGMLNHPESFVSVDVAPIIKFINQSAIISQSDTDKIVNFSIKDGTLTLMNRTSSYSMPVTATASYTVKFAIDYIKSVLSNFDSDTINIAPMMRSGNDENGNPIQMVIGCIFWTDTLTTVLAGQG